MSVREIEFVCRGCGANVFSIDFSGVNDNDPGYCMTCQWLNNIENPEDREGLRRFLEKTGSL